jgi:hypothetical protein
MAIEFLTESERMIVLSCLRAVVSRGDWAETEIPTVFGVDKSVFDLLIDEFPNIDDSDLPQNANARRAIRNSLCMYYAPPKLKEGASDPLAGILESDIEAVYQKWIRLAHWGKFARPLEE